MAPSCFVPDCKSGYVSSRKRNKLEGKKNPTIFGAPSDAKTFDLWVQTVPCKHRPFGRNDGICEYHFTEDCILRFVRSPLSERRRLNLKRGSVPTIFPDNTPTENDLKRKVPNRHSTKVEHTDSNATETSVNDESVAESSLSDNRVAELSAEDENITDSLPPNHSTSELTHANIEQSTHDTIPESSHPGTELTKLPADQIFESSDENIKLPPPEDHVYPPSPIDIVEISSPESSEDETDEPSISNSSDQSAYIPNSSSAVWSLDDLCDYVSSLSSLKDDNFTCCRVQSAAILQQWHPTSYHCVKMIIIEENLRPQIFVENERVCSEELLSLNKISSETKLRSLITLVKELKALPKISDFHLESFYKKIVQQN